MRVPPGNGEQLGEAVRRRLARQARQQHESEGSLAEDLAFIGVLGASIVVPTLGGIFLGRWLDRHFGTGISCTLSLLVAGLTLGCFLAWQRIQRIHGK